MPMIPGSVFLSRPEPVKGGGPVQPTPPLPHDVSPRPLGADPLMDLSDAILGALGINDPFPASASRATGVGAMVGAALPLAGGVLGGIRAFHGGPHSFDKFKMSQVGTGEGSQAFGHGLYFAENENVAKSYRDTLSSGVNRLKLGGKDVFAGDAAKLADLKGMSPDDTAGLVWIQQSIDNNTKVTLPQLRKGYIKQLGNTTPGSDVHTNVSKALRTLDKYGDQITIEPPPKGHMYEVDLDVDPASMLAWDKPLTDQPKQAQDLVHNSTRISPSKDGFLVESLGRRHFTRTREEAENWASGLTGENIYHGLVETTGKKRANITQSADGTWKVESGALGGVYTHEEDARAAYDRLSKLGTPRSASKTLAGQGIPGIKYLDQGSRDSGEGTHNFVIFDDSVVSILRKYGLLMPLAGAATAIPTSASADPLQRDTRVRVATPTRPSAAPEPSPALVSRRAKSAWFEQQGLPIPDEFNVPSWNNPANQGTREYIPRSPYLAEQDMRANR